MIEANGFQRRPFHSPSIVGKTKVKAKRADSSVQRTHLSIRRAVMSDIAVLVYSMQLEDTFGQINPECRDFHGGSSLSLYEAAILTHYEVILRGGRSFH